MFYLCLPPCDEIGSVVESSYSIKQHMIHGVCIGTVNQESVCLLCYGPHSIASREVRFDPVSRRQAHLVGSSAKAIYSCIQWPWHPTDSTHLAFSMNISLSKHDTHISRMPISLHLRALLEPNIYHCEMINDGARSDAAEQFHASKW